MKIIRSTKCSLKFATKKKQNELVYVLKEYGRVVNIFIHGFWRLNTVPSKVELLKEIVDKPYNTWLSARLRKVAAREAIDMIKAAKERYGKKATMPLHKGLRMNISSTIGELQDIKNSKVFDAWLHLSSIGNKTNIYLPIKYHKQYLKWKEKVLSNRLNSYIITKDYVQFCFEIETGKKKTEGREFGIDTGINKLATLSDGSKLGIETKYYIDRINKCKYGSKNQKQKRKAFKQYVDEIAKEIISLNPKLIVVEALKNINYKIKFKRRLNKNIRRSLGSWVYRYWLTRLQLNCEENRVSFRTVQPYYTSQRCSKCSHTESKNRLEVELFKCQKCGYTDDADVNAAINILNLFLQGKYGSLYKANCMS